jgi:YegS/Rv2252/BmrU family lipid kinase
MLLVFNPIAGRGEFSRSLYNVVDIFSRAGYEVVVYPTAASDDARAYIQTHGANFDLVVCSGGDGIVNEAVTACMCIKSPPPLGYIPCGTTNDFAVSLNIPHDYLEAARFILNGQPRLIDIGVFGHRFFSYVAAFGKYTDVSYSTAQSAKSIFGRTAYILKGVTRFSSYSSVDCNIDIDSEKISGSFVLGIITNVTSVAGFRVQSDGESFIDDGLFEAIFVRRIKKLADRSKVIAALTKPSVSTDYVVKRTAKRVDLSFEKPCGWTIDGEFGGEHTSITVENRHRALNIIM